MEDKRGGFSGGVSSNKQGSGSRNLDPDPEFSFNPTMELSFDPSVFFLFGIFGKEASAREAPVPSSSLDQSSRSIPRDRCIILLPFLASSSCRRRRSSHFFSSLLLRGQISNLVSDVLYPLRIVLTAYAQGRRRTDWERTGRTSTAGFTKKAYIVQPLIPT
jgi:hypothetical protein